jgi:hypothetical protein
LAILEERLRAPFQSDATLEANDESPSAALTSCAGTLPGAPPPWTFTSSALPDTMSVSTLSINLQIRSKSLQTNLGTVKLMIQILAKIIYNKRESQNIVDLFKLDTTKKAFPYKGRSEILKYREIVIVL